MGFTNNAKFRAYYLLTLICVIYMFDYADRHVMASLLPFIKAEWQIADMDLGLLTSVVSLTIGIFTIPLSILVDRWSRKKMISIMVFVWSIATLMCAFAENYYQLLAFRALTGLGEAAYASAAVAMIMKTFPGNHRAKFIGFYNAAAPLGAGLGMAVGGYIGMIYGWRHAFGIVAIPGIILAVQFWFVNDYRTIPLTEKSLRFMERLKMTLLTIVDLLKIKTLWYMYFCYALIIGVNTSVLNWSPSYLERFLHFNRSTAGSLSGAIAALVLIGAPLGGYISDRWLKIDKNAKLKVSYISTILSAIALGVALFTDNKTLAMTGFFVFGIFTVMYLAPATSIIQEVVNPGMRASSFWF
ncbi:MAG: MFS transporter [Bacteroidales bacterium]|nr:MFS transporter [Bacteroidales bacterium]